MTNLKNYIMTIAELRYTIASLTQELGTDLTANDEVMIEINGHKIELHKKETLKRVLGFETI